MSKSVVVCNPSAGSASPLLETIVRMAEWHGCALKYPKNKADLAAVVTDASQSDVQRLVIAGGDGTLSRVANVVYPLHQNLELAILPLGTGNDLARALNIPIDDIEVAFEMAVTRPALPADLITLRNGTESYCINAATGGFGGEVTAGLNSGDKHVWGSFSYWLTAMGRLVDLHSYQLKLLIDGEPYQQRVFGMSLANGRYVGGGFPIARQALINDGLLDLMIIPEMPTLELLSAGMNYFLDNTMEGTGVVTKRARRVEIHSQPEMSFSVDGEPIFAFDAAFEVIPGAIRIVPGEDAPSLAPAV